MTWTLDYTFCGTICWIDIETDGLRAEGGHILEVACVITDWKMKEIAHFHEVLHQEKKMLYSMNDWCKRQHGATGLVDECLQSTQTLRSVEKLLDHFIQAHCDERTPLAGATVHFDRKWLELHMPIVLETLSYRNLDVSAWKMLFASVGIKLNISMEGQAHRAMDDIRDSIAQAKAMRLSLGGLLGPNSSLLAHGTLPYEPVHCK